MVWPSFTMAAGFETTLAAALLVVKLVSGLAPTTVARAPVLNVSERCGLFSAA